MSMTRRSLLALSLVLGWLIPTSSALAFDIRGGGDQKVTVPAGEIVADLLHEMSAHYHPEHPSNREAAKPRRRTLSRTFSARTSECSLSSRSTEAWR